MSKKQELIDFILSLDEEQVAKLVSRLDYLKSFTDEDIKKLETVKPNPEPPKRQSNRIVTETPLPFQKRGDGVSPFQKMKR